MNPLKDYFYYSKKERLAVLLLCSTATLLLFLGTYWSLFIASTPSNSLDWQEELADFQQHQTNSPSKKPYSKKKSYKLYASSEATYGAADFPTTTRSSSAILRPVPFDPNTVTAEELTAMKVPQRTIKSWMNYRNKGGRFKNKEALSRIYTLEAKHYEALKDYIQLPEENVPTTAAPLGPAFDFDPNTSAPEELTALGLSAKTIKSIVNYRNKGGVFREPSDFKKIYTLPDSLYQHLAAHIKIVEQPQQRSYAAKKAPNYQTIDVNQASTTDFEQFRGIGPSYARRLVEWRERLGGFTQIEQVGELYRLPDSTFQQMRPFLSCTPSPLTTINVNTATVEELKAHPYLRWSHAKAIVQYRERKGPWKSVDFLQILPELDDGQGTFERVKAYLRVQ